MGPIGLIRPILQKNRHRSPRVHPGIATDRHSVILPPLNPDDAEDSLVRALMEPLPKTGYLTAAGQEFLETWKPKLLDAFRQAREKLQALE